MSDVGPCALHVPHKRWAYRTDVDQDGQLEEDNYVYLEQWSRRFVNCFPVSGEGPSPVPSQAEMLWGRTSSYGYYNSLLGPTPGPSPGSDEEIRYFRQSPDGSRMYEGPGVTHDEPLGAPNFYGDALHWFCPPMTDVTVTLRFDFVEVDAPATWADPITRGLRLRIVRDSDSAEIVNVYQTYTGNRGMVHGVLVSGLHDLPFPFTIYSYCNWTNVMTGTSSSRNTYSGRIIEVTGTLL